MELLVWSAVRRLAWLVAGAMALVAVPYFAGAPMGHMPAATGGLAMTLYLGAMVPMWRAKRMLAAAAKAPSEPPARLAYRASARPWDPEALELEATHFGAIALLLLGVAAALVVVTAASR